jgi:ATP-dependent RNA helicase RhlE
MVPEDYVHRVGRTARAKATGDAITFVSADEEKYFAQIEKTLGKRLDRAKTPELPPAAAHDPHAAFVPRRQPRPPRPQGQPGTQGRPARPDQRRTTTAR